MGETNGIIFHKPYGLADRETGRKNTSHTVFTANSITKLFTALLTMKLQSEKLLDLDDRISQHILNVPEDKKNITIRHLLTHTAGIKRNGLAGGDTNLEATREVVLENVLNSDLPFPPGARQEYSNIGYTLLAIIAENITNNSYENLLFKKILKPSRMFQTGYLLPDYKDADLAKGYRGDKKIEAVINLPQLADGLTWNIRGNGGLHSNIFDMYRFYLALNKEIFIEKGLLEIMLKKPIDNLQDNKYHGIGFEVEIENNLRDVSHSGGNGYFSADFHWLIDEGKMFYIATNDGSINIGQVSNNIKKIIRNQSVEMPPKIVFLSTDSLKHYTSSYLSESDDTVEIEIEDENLKLTADTDEGIQAIFGLKSKDSEKELHNLAQKSKEILHQEFSGNFKPKFLAMNKSTSVESLKRYHQYDAKYWKEQFGEFKKVQIIATAGSTEYAAVLLKINFDNGAAAEIYTWKKGILSNISVYPDWSQFEFGKKIYPLTNERFQSYSINSPIITTVQFLFERNTSKLIGLIVNDEQLEFVKNGR